MKSIVSKAAGNYSRLQFSTMELVSSLSPFSLLPFASSRAKKIDMYTGCRYIRKRTNWETSDKNAAGGHIKTSTFLLSPLPPPPLLLLEFLLLKRLNPLLPPPLSSLLKKSDSLLSSAVFAATNEASVLASSKVFGLHFQFPAMMGVLNCFKSSGQNSSSCSLLPGFNFSNRFSLFFCSGVFFNPCPPPKSADWILTPELNFLLLVMMTPFRRCCCCCCCCCLARRRLLLKTPMLLVVVVVVISSASSFENNTNAQDNGEWSNELKRIERASDTFFFVVRFGGKSREQNFIYKSKRFWLFRQPTSSSHFYTRESIFQLFTTLPHFIHHSHEHSHTQRQRQREGDERRNALLLPCCWDFY